MEKVTFEEISLEEALEFIRSNRSNYLFAQQIGEESIMSVKEMSIDISDVKDHKWFVKSMENSDINSELLGYSSTFPFDTIGQLTPAQMDEYLNKIGRQYREE